jgi:hypothetical protein
MELDGLGRNEQSRRNFAVGQALRHEVGNVPLSRRELVNGGRRAAADAREFIPRALRPDRCAEAVELCERRVQKLPRVALSPGTPQCASVCEQRPRSFERRKDALVLPERAVERLCRSREVAFGRSKQPAATVSRSARNGTVAPLGAFKKAAERVPCIVEPTQAEQGFQLVGRKAQRLSHAAAFEPIHERHRSIDDCRELAEREIEEA